MLKEILQSNFSIDSILDAIEGSDESAPQNSCAEELKKVAPISLWMPISQHCVTNTVLNGSGTGSQIHHFYSGTGQESQGVSGSPP